MSTRSEPWNDIEAVLDEMRIEEEAQLAVMEALGELEDPTGDEFPWDELWWATIPGDPPVNAVHR